MKRMLMGALVATVLGCGMDVQAFEIHRHDCTSPSDYLASNGQRFVGLMSALVPFLPGSWVEAGFQPATGPALQAQAHSDFAGVLTSIFSVWAQFGINPTERLNFVLGFVCLEAGDA